MLNADCTPSRTIQFRIGQMALLPYLFSHEFSRNFGISVHATTGHSPGG